MRRSARDSRSKGAEFIEMGVQSRILFLTDSSVLSRIVPCDCDHAIAIERVS